MAYKTPPVGTILPAKKNTTVTNPGDTHDLYGDTEWRQADAQDKAFDKNEILVEEYQNQVATSPAYAEQLAAAPVWAVVVIAAEADNVTFDLQRAGVPLKSWLHPAQRA
jgi:acetyl esterase/lipase